VMRLGYTRGKNTEKNTGKRKKRGTHRLDFLAQVISKNGPNSRWAV